MAKTTAGRDLRIYMKTHSTLVYFSTKFDVNQPKYKRVRVSYILPYEGKVYLWQCAQKYSKYELENVHRVP